MKFKRLKPNRLPRGGGLPFSHILEFLSEVVSLLTSFRDFTKPSFFLSTAHKRELLTLALRSTPDPRHRANMATGTVVVQRSLTQAMLPQFVAFVKEAFPVERTTGALTQLCGDDWKMTEVDLPQTLTCTHGASGMQLCVPCRVCQHVGPVACGTIVLSQCPVCITPRDECLACCEACDACQHTVCQKCVFRDPATGDVLCRDCGFVCAACQGLELLDNGWWQCAGVADDHPCPHNLGQRCEGCSGGIMCCDDCSRDTCPECCEVFGCDFCCCCYCVTCRGPSTACFGCGIPACSKCRVKSMFACDSCGNDFCTTCSNSTMQRCGCCGRICCALCETFESCYRCGDSFCALSTCAGVSGRCKGCGSS